MFQYLMPLWICVMISIFIWLIKTGKNEENIRDILIRENNVPKSHAVQFGATAFLGFNLDTKTAVFANWHTYIRDFYKDMDGKICYGKTDMCKYSDNEPMSNIKEFCVYDDADETCDIKKLMVCFKSNPKYSGHQGSLEAFTYLPANEVEKVIRLIESVGIKIDSHPIKNYSISWGN